MTSRGASAVHGRAEGPPVLSPGTGLGQALHAAGFTGVTAFADVVREHPASEGMRQAAVIGIAVR